MNRLERLALGTQKFSRGIQGGARRYALIASILAAPLLQGCPSSPNLPPEVFLNGSEQVTIEAGQAPYSDPGAIALDPEEGDIGCQSAGSVNTMVPGEYTIQYTSNPDSEGLRDTAQRTVSVQDTTAPALNVTNPEDITLEAGIDPYTPMNATATDIVNGDLTGEITISGTANTMIPGVYTETVSVADTAGNTSSYERTVTVQDTTAPTIIGSGSGEIIIEAGNQYTEPIVTATDIVDRVWQVAGSGDTVDTFTPGVYNRTWTATDNAGNTSPTLSQRISVVDETAPTFSQNGSPITSLPDVEIPFRGQYNLPENLTANDIVSRDLTSRILLEGHEGVSSITPGQYTVNITVDDDAGNTRALTQNVEMLSPTNNVSFEHKTLPEWRDRTDPDFTYHVEVPGEIYNSLQEALENVADDFPGNDPVALHLAGIEHQLLYENGSRNTWSQFRIDLEESGLYLIGDEGAVIGNGIVAYSPDGRVSDIGIIGINFPPINVSGTDALIFWDTENSLIYGNVFGGERNGYTGPSGGIDLSNTKNMTVKNNSFTDLWRVWPGGEVNGVAARIYLEEADANSKIRFCGNSILRCNRGLSVAELNQGALERLEIYDNVFAGNVEENIGVGASMYSRGNLDLRGNAFKRVVSGGEYGDPIDQDALYSYDIFGEPYLLDADKIQKTISEQDTNPPYNEADVADIKTTPALGYHPAIDGTVSK